MEDLLLASVFGGIILGIGVGLIIRYGGSLDGTEIVAKGGYTGEARTVLYLVVTRLEIVKLKTTIDEIDEHPFVTISEVHEVMGGRIKKRAIH